MAYYNKGGSYFYYNAQLVQFLDHSTQRLYSFLIGLEYVSLGLGAFGIIVIFVLSFIIGLVLVFVACAMSITALLLMRFKVMAMVDLGIARQGGQPTVQGQPGPGQPVYYQGGPNSTPVAYIIQGQPPPNPAYYQQGYPPPNPASNQQGYPPPNPAFTQQGYPPPNPAYNQQGYPPQPGVSYNQPPLYNQASGSQSPAPIYNPAPSAEAAHDKDQSK